MGRNPLPLVVPCHRVVAADGLGGYGGGLEPNAACSSSRACFRHGSISATSGPAGGGQPLEWRRCCLDEIARTSEEVAGTSARNRKTALIADSLRALRPEEVPIAVAYLAGELPQGSVGVGWALALAALAGAGAHTRAPRRGRRDRPDCVGVGKGIAGTRKTEVAQLFGRATEREQRFLRSLLLGELRQGALEGVMLDAVAKAAGAGGPRSGGRRCSPATCRRSRRRPRRRRAGARPLSPRRCSARWLMLAQTAATRERARAAEPSGRG